MLLLRYNMTSVTGPALGRFKLFGDFRGPPFWMLKYFRINYVGQFEQLWP